MIRRLISAALLAASASVAVAQTPAIPLQAEPLNSQIGNAVAGTVTSVDCQSSNPSFATLTGGPIVAAGTCIWALATQSPPSVAAQALIFAGPIAGESVAVPTFRIADCYHLGAGCPMTTGVMTTASGIPTWASQALFPFVRVLFNPASTPITVGPSSTTESDIFGTQSSGVTITGGTMGTNGQIKADCWGKFLNNGGSNETLTGRVYFGGTKFIDSGVTASIGTSAGTRVWHLEADVQNEAATNANRAHMSFQLGNSTAATTGNGGWAGNSLINEESNSQSTAFTIDTTANQAFRVTLQNTNVGTAANIQWTSYRCTITAIPNVP